MPKRSSGETLTIIVTIGIFIAGAALTLYLSLSSRLDSLSDRLGDLHQYREERLEFVRQDLQGSVDDLEDSVKDTVEDLESRIRAIEVAQSYVAGQLTVMPAGAERE